jgi:hypothetical protein
MLSKQKPPGHSKRSTHEPNVVFARLPQHPLSAWYVYLMASRTRTGAQMATSVQTLYAYVKNDAVGL